MTLDDLMQDPYTKKVFLGLVGMLARDYQARALDMTAEQLYESREFFPVYNPDKHDYTTKAVGYTCRAEDGTIMQLMDSSAYAISTLAEGEENVTETPIMWHCVWSNDPMLAKPFKASEFSPYMKGNCCVFDSKIYRSLEDDNISSPEDYPDGWEEVQIGF